jgi:hypothetical protein
MIGNLGHGTSRSCGCLKREATVKRLTTHGLSKTPENKIWKEIRARCYRTSSKHYKYYGGRGIKVCEQWKMSFKSFLDDMGFRPSAKHSINRKDNDGDYEPGNCEWATALEQSRNKRTNRIVIIDGEPMCMMEVSLRYGVPYDRLKGRLNAGWSPEKAVSEKKYCRR